MLDVVKAKPKLILHIIGYVHQNACKIDILRNGDDNIVALIVV